MNRPIAQLDACRRNNNVRAACSEAKASLCLKALYSRGTNPILPALLRRSITSVGARNCRQFPTPEDFLADHWLGNRTRFRAVADHGGMFWAADGDNDHSSNRASNPRPACPGTAQTTISAAMPQDPDAAIASCWSTTSPQTWHRSSSRVYRTLVFAREAVSLGQSEPLWPVSTDEIQYRFTGCVHFVTPVTVTLVPMQMALDFEWGLRASDNCQRALNDRKSLDQRPSMTRFPKTLATNGTANLNIS